MAAFVRMLMAAVAVAITDVLKDWIGKFFGLVYAWAAHLLGLIPTIDGASIDTLDVTPIVNILNLIAPLVPVWALRIVMYEAVGLMGASVVVAAWQLPSFIRGLLPVGR